VEEAELHPAGHQQYQQVVTEGMGHGRLAKAGE
jgi:hypothetical protein